MPFDVDLVDPGTLGDVVFSAAVSLEQGSQANAKEDTVALFLDGVFDEDLSQFGSGLTAVDLGGYKDADALRAITGATGRELYIRVPIDVDDASCALLIHADPADAASNTYRISWDVAAFGEITFIQASTTLYSYQPVHADVADISIQWSTRANPDTTGAGDALLSEFTIFDQTAGDYLVIQKQVTHAVPTTNAAWTLSVGGFWDGTSLIIPSRQVQQVRIGLAGDHSSVEFHEDWILEQSAPIADYSPIPALIGPLTVAGGTGDAGEFAGSVNMGWLARHNFTQSRRLWSPLVNEYYFDPDPWDTSAGTIPQWRRFAPGSVTYQLVLNKLRWVPVPRGATHAWVRIQVRSYVTSGAAVPIKLRVYAMNHDPDLVLNPPPPVFEYAFAESDTLTIDHTSTGIGEWLTWETGDDGVLIKLPVWTDPHPVAGYLDTVHLCLAYAIDPAAASANDANARIEVRSWHVRPTTVNDGNPLGEFSP
jgi:hypothetical protein